MIPKEIIIAQVTETLKRDFPKLADKIDHINRSYLFAIAELTARFRKQDRLTSYTEGVSNNAREISLDGSPGDMDVSSIFYIVYDPGEEQAVLHYVDPGDFLKQYNNDEASAGIPSKYTFVGLDSNNYIRIRFDVPVATSASMDVWYFRDMDENVIRNTEGPALINMTMAYVLGTGTKDGIIFHHLATGNIKVAKANAKRIVDFEKGFVQSQTDRTIASARASIRNSR